MEHGYAARFETLRLRLQTSAGEDPAGGSHVEASAWRRRARAILRSGAASVMSGGRIVYHSAVSTPQHHRQRWAYESRSRCSAPSTSRCSVRGGTSAAAWTRDSLWCIRFMNHCQRPCSIERSGVAGRWGVVSRRASRFKRGYGTVVWRRVWTGAMISRTASRDRGWMGRT